MKKITLPEITTFQWDEGNATKNKKKHNVEQHECEEVFDNKPYISFEDPVHSENEQRYTILGITNNDRKLTLALTIRNNNFRVTMARDQSRKERLFFKTHRYDKT